MAVPYDFEADQGATWEIPLTWLQPQTPEQVAADEPGDPVDLTGYTAAMQLRADWDTDSVLDASTTPASMTGRIILTDADAGEFSVVVDYLVTETVPVDGAKTRYRYDLELTSPPTVDFPDGRRTRLVDGRVTVKRQVTQIP